MTDIPEDLRAMAEAVVDRGYDVGLINAVLAALMSERERCAKIAETRRSTPSRDMDAYGTRLALDIASAIRNPTTRRAAQ
jgi:hypothetical protein